MDKLFQTILLGMYAPIIVLSGTACYLYVIKILVPAMKGRYFHFESHAVALAAIMALMAHFSENVYYGVGRFDAGLFDWMSNQLIMVGLMKVLILASAVLATAVYNKARFGISNIGKLMTLVVVLWLGASGLLWEFADLHHV